MMMKKLMQMKKRTMKKKMKMRKRMRMTKTTRTKKKQILKNADDVCSSLLHLELRLLFSSFGRYNCKKDTLKEDEDKQGNLPHEMLSSSSSFAGMGAWQ